MNAGHTNAGIYFDPKAPGEEGSPPTRSGPWWCLVFLLAICFLAPTAVLSDEPRVALVIGNGGYTSLGRLENPVNDMALMAETLRELGFEVIERADADQATLKRAIKDFGVRLERAGRDAVGLFYFAGHGVQVQGTNYLIPLGAEIARESDIEIEAVSLDWVLAQMEFARNRLNIVILDSCRNNPLTRSFRSGEQGLSRIDAPRGTLIAYATEPGGVSIDGDGPNSPYTAALAETVREPGLAAEIVFRKVRVRVLEATGGAQVPWESSSLTGEFRFTVAPQPPSDRASASEPAGNKPGQGGAELRFWETVKDSDDPRLYQAYLSTYPDGLFANLAKVQLERLASSDGASKDGQPKAVPPGAHATGPTEQVVSSAPGFGAEYDRLGEPKGEVGASEDAGLEVTQAAVLTPLSPPDPARLAGRWEGRFRCQQDVVGMALEIEPPQDDQITARFEFFPVAGAPSFPPGSFRVAGSYDGRSGRLQLRAGEWIERQWGFQRHGLLGTATEEDDLLIDGRVLSSGCSEFAVRRPSNPQARGEGGEHGSS